MEQLIYYPFALPFSVFKELYENHERKFPSISLCASGIDFVFLCRMYALHKDKPVVYIVGDTDLSEQRFAFIEVMSTFFLEFSGFHFPWLKLEKDFLTFIPGNIRNLGVTLIENERYSFLRFLELDVLTLYVDGEVTMPSFNSIRSLSIFLKKGGKIKLEEETGFDEIVSLKIVSDSDQTQLAQSILKLLKPPMEEIHLDFPGAGSVSRQFPYIFQDTEKKLFRSLHNSGNKLVHSTLGWTTNNDNNLLIQREMTLDDLHEQLQREDGARFIYVNKVIFPSHYSRETTFGEIFVSLQSSQSCRVLYCGNVVFSRAYSMVRDDVSVYKKELILPGSNISPFKFFVINTVNITCRFTNFSCCEFLKYI